MHESTMVALLNRYEVISLWTQLLRRSWAIHLFQTRDAKESRDVDVIEDEIRHRIGGRVRDRLRGRESVQDIR